MKGKSLIIGILVALCAAAGLYALVKLPGRRASANEDDEGGGQAAATVITVQTGALRRLTLHEYVNGYGIVEPAPATARAPAADAPLAAPTAGVVARVDVVPGQRVEKGQVLMELNSGSVTAEYARQELARQQQLFEQHNTSLRNFQSAQEQLALLQVRSPLAGTVVRVNVKPGAAVDLSTVVAEIIDLDRLAVTTRVPDWQAGALKAGQELQVLAQPPVGTTLTFVSPVVDDTDGTVLARAPLPAGSGLRPGQFVSLRIAIGVHTNCLAAPEAAVVTDAGGHSVIARVQGDQAARIPVQTGYREDGWVEITGPGLEAGDPVVTVGAYGLPQKTQIQVVNPPSAE